MSRNGLLNSDRNELKVGHGHYVYRSGNLIRYIFKLYFVKQFIARTYAVYMFDEYLKITVIR